MLVVGEVALATASAPGSASEHVAAGLRWLDPWVPLLWLVFTALGAARMVQLLNTYRAQGRCRDALHLSSPSGGAGRAVTSSRPFWLGAGLAAAWLAWVVWALEGGPGHALWQSWDVAFQQWAKAAVQTQWLPALQRFTDLGDVIFITVLTVLGAVWLAWRKRWLDVQIWVFFNIFNGLLIRLLKLTFDRARPENLHDLLVSGASFPSGHSAGSALVYVLLAALLTVRQSRAVRWLCVTLAVLWATGIGLSRILLSVHWFSDVVAGVTLGCIGVLAACAVRLQLSRAQG